MKAEIIYKGAYLSEPLFRVSGVPDGEKRWILLIWQGGFQYDMIFSDLKFWAKKQVIQQGFKK